MFLLLPHSTCWTSNPLTSGASQPVLVDCQSVLQLWPIPRPGELVMTMASRQWQRSQVAAAFLLLARIADVGVSAD